MAKTPGVPTPAEMGRWSVGGSLIDALARRDFDGIGGCFDPDVRLRALLPMGPVELNGRDEVVGEFQCWFGGPDEIEVVDATVGDAGSRLYLRWRVGLVRAGSTRQDRLVEQHAFATTGERIAALDLLCSGFVPQPSPRATNKVVAPCRAVINLTTGPEDPEKGAVAFLMAVGAAEEGRPTLMFLSRETVRVASDGVAVGVACPGCPPSPELVERYAAAGVRYLVCPPRLKAIRLDKGDLIARAELRRNRDAPAMRGRCLGQHLRLLTPASGLVGRGHVLSRSGGRP